MPEAGKILQFADGKSFTGVGLPKTIAAAGAAARRWKRLRGGGDYFAADFSESARRDFLRLAVGRAMAPTLTALS